MHGIRLILPWPRYSKSASIRNGMVTVTLDTISDMSNPAPDKAQAAETKSGPKTFAEFLESYGPNAAYTLPDLVTLTTSGPDLLATPEITLHCPKCEGNRRFATASTNAASTEAKNAFTVYVCKNCEEYNKTFALVFRQESYGVKAGLVLKVGEFPQFGPPTPPRVMKLVGEDRELFLKGRRAELHGLGVGAFAYYRRVVEEQKGRIINEVGKVAIKLHPSKETEALFVKAAAEKQFTTAIDMIKAAIPESLRIGGHNPLSLLHDALSEWLHVHSDEECLELATSIRVVLTELAERISLALKEEAELKAAVSKLLNRKSV